MDVDLLKKKNHNNNTATGAANDNMLIYCSLNLLCFFLLYWVSQYWFYL